MSNSNMTDEQRAAEVSSARSKKKRYEAQKAAKERTYRSNCEKISRLKVTKATLKEQKETAKSRYKNIKKYTSDSENFTNWTGVNFDKTHGALENTIVPEYKGYCGRIDDALDAVCDEITRLENENLQLNGDILYLASAINSLINFIEKLLN